MRNTRKDQSPVDYSLEGHTRRKKYDLWESNKIGTEKQKYHSLRCRIVNRVSLQKTKSIFSRYTVRGVSEIPKMNFYSEI